MTVTRHVIFGRLRWAAVGNGKHGIGRTKREAVRSWRRALTLTQLSARLSEAVQRVCDMAAGAIEKAGRVA